MRDGAEIFSKSDETGRIGDSKEFEIFNGALVPGNHTSNLAASGTTGTIAVQSEAIMQDYKAGHIIGSTPRFLTYAAALEMNPLDAADRVPELKERHGVGLCNITRCCTKVCPEHITITENAIIPLKERVVDRYYDPLTRLLRVFKS